MERRFFLLGEKDLSPRKAGFCKLFSQAERRAAQTSEKWLSWGRNGQDHTSNFSIVPKFNQNMIKMINNT